MNLLHSSYSHPLGQIVGLLLQDNVTQQEANEMVKASKETAKNLLKKNPLPQEPRERVHEESREKEHERKHGHKQEAKKQKLGRKQARKHMKEEHTNHAERYSLFLFFLCLWPYFPFLD